MKKRKKQRKKESQSLHTQKDSLSVKALGEARSGEARSGEETGGLAHGFQSNSKGLGLLNSKQLFPRSHFRGWKTSKNPSYHQKVLPPIDAHSMTMMDPRWEIHSEMEQRWRRIEFEKWIDSRMNFQFLPSILAMDFLEFEVERFEQLEYVKLAYNFDP